MALAVAQFVESASGLPMDTSPGTVDAAESGWLPPLRSAQADDDSLRSVDGFFALAEQLTDDSAWAWLGALITMLKDIQRPAELASEQTRRAAERYRIFLRINQALGRTLTEVRARLAHVDDIPLAPRITVRRGLSRWQERRAKQYLLSNLGARISNADIAAACGLSQNYFVTAFRQGTGETPHTCLLRYRIARAKELLRGPMPIADIALACGFGDQSHLTRVFAKHTGIAPGEWRRERREDWNPGGETPCPQGRRAKHGQHVTQIGEGAAA